MSEVDECEENLCEALRALAPSARKLRDVKEVLLPRLRGAAEEQVGGSRDTSDYDWGWYDGVHYAIAELSDLLTEEPE